jgi:hypothetical protein
MIRNLSKLICIGRYSLLTASSSAARHEWLPSSSRIHGLRSIGVFDFRSGRLLRIVRWITHAHSLSKKQLTYKCLSSVIIYHLH